MLVVLGCGNSGGGGSGSEAAAKVVREVPLAYVKRVNTLGMNPTDGTPSAPGGDLMLREQSSPSAPEHNLTAKFTQGKGDASDPEVSYDGKKIVFCDALPELEHLDHRRRAGLHRPLEHLGIRHEQRRPDRRQLPAPDRRRPATTTSTRRTCRPGAASSSRRTARRKIEVVNQALGRSRTSRSTSTSASGC